MLNFDGPDSDLSDRSCYTPWPTPTSLYGSYTDLADGTHTLRVRQRQRAVQRGPLEHTFTVETAPP
ncbi:MAG: hypothetical protein M9922_04185 [Microthrixaceae bacterium]|nr:hypothetical protein [Microthrixaceae bacterium]